MFNFNHFSPSIRHCCSETYPASDLLNAYLCTLPVVKWHVIVKAPFRSHLRPCGICGVLSSTGIVLPTLLRFLHIYDFTNSLYSFVHLSPELYSFDSWQRTEITHFRNCFCVNVVLFIPSLQFTHQPINLLNRTTRLAFWDCSP